MATVYNQCYKLHLFKVFEDAARDRRTKDLWKSKVFLVEPSMYKDEIYFKTSDDFHTVCCVQGIKWMSHITSAECINLWNIQVINFVPSTQVETKKIGNQKKHNDCKHINLLYIHMHILHICRALYFQQNLCEDFINGQKRTPKVDTFAASISENSD